MGLLGDQTAVSALTLVAGLVWVELFNVVEPVGEAGILVANGSLSGSAATEELCLSEAKHVFAVWVGSLV